LPGLAVEHVYSPTSYSLLGIYRGLPPLLRHLGPRLTGVAHLFGVPLALAPRLRKSGARVVAHVMTSSSGASGRLLNGASGLLFDRWVDQYAVSSPALVQPLVRRGVRRSKIAIVPPAIDTTVFQPGDRLAARALLNLHPDEPLVVYLGRLSPRRFPAADVAYGLRSLAHTLGRSVRFVGLSPDQTYDGSENTSEYLLACTRAAAADLRGAAGVTVDIRLGNLADAAKIAWLQAADVVLLPFAQPESVEPPLTLLEALACGARVVLTPPANRSGIVENAVNGLVYAGPEQLASTLGHLLTAESAATAVSEAARASAVDGYSFASTAAASVRLWDQLERDAPPLVRRSVR
jgi:glycosyltransferase involved in cell wall biosynthesis